jgi:SP family facilitated glucose transporter-like MFS transporter 8
LSTFLATIVVGIVQLVAACLSSLIVERTGRRVLLLFSNVTMAVCHLVLAVYFYLKQNCGDLRNFGWLPLLSVATFIAGFCIGFGPLPWVMLTKLYLMNRRAGRVHLRVL